MTDYGDMMNRDVYIGQCNYLGYVVEWRGIRLAVYHAPPPYRKCQ